MPSRVPDDSDSEGVPVRVYDRLFIGGDWVKSTGSGTIEVISPGTEEPIGRVPDSTEADVDAAVAAARQAFDFGPWPRTSPAERADLLAGVSATIQARSEEIARTITEQNGSPISWSLMGQVFSATMVLDYYVGLAREHPFEEARAGIMGPALVAGCTVVLKPAPETPLDANVLAEILAEAGLPPGVVNVVPAGREVGEHLVTHPGVDKIGFTGSTAAGKRIAALCGERLKRVTLELGGKSAAIVLPDADIDEVAAGLLPASLMNNGEACVAQTRILAPRDQYQRLVDQLCERVGAMSVGDPLDPVTEIGPLVTSRQRERVEGYIAAGQEEGAKVALGGGRPSGLSRGWYVEPTVFVDVDNRMRIAQEEIFGPVLAVIPYGEVDEAVSIANDSTYGLSGSVWSADVDRGLDIARRVRTGTYTVNGFMLEFGAPFGGYKESGIGRELGPEGLAGYLEYKSVSMPAGWTPPATS